MKEYPITEETFDMIGTLRNSASVFFSIGSLAFGIAISTLQALSFADSKVGIDVVAMWKACGWAASAVSVGAYIAGIIFYAKGSSVMARVKSETVHDEG